MKFPSSLNPLRGTQWSWLFPLTWALIKCAALAAPTTLEVFIHHHFGERSGKALVKGFLLLLFLSLTVMRDDPIFPSFLVAYIILAFGHWFLSQIRPPADQIHSYSLGEPWPLWREISTADISFVRQFIEPAFTFFLSSIVSLFALSLAKWLLVATVALFIKEQLRRFELRTRRLDVIDHRAETERLAPRPRAESEPFIEARQAPPMRRSRDRTRNN